jgi:type III restriction enzyme
MSLQLKNYQNQSLQALEQYFTLAASFGAERAFKQCVAKIFNITTD